MIIYIVLLMHVNRKHSDLPRAGLSEETSFVIPIPLGGIGVDLHGD